MLDFYYEITAKTMVSLKHLFLMGSFFLPISLLSPSATAQSSQIEVCISAANASAGGRGFFGVSRGAVQEILENIKTATGVSLSDLELVECPGLGSAYAIRDPALVPGQTLGRYVVYDPDWLRQVVGENRLEALAIFSHELGHFVNGHFDYAAGVEKKQIESEADYFSGCSMARLENGSDGWAALSSVYSRLRDEQGGGHPNRFESLDSVRQGYETCWTSTSGRAAPPGQPLTAELQKYLEALIDWTRNSDIESNLKAAEIALLTSALLDNRLPSSVLLTNIISNFQREIGLTESGEFDRDTIDFINGAINDGVIELRKHSADARKVRLTDCVDPQVLQILSATAHLEHLNMRGANFCDEPEYYESLASLTQIRILNLRGVFGVTPEIATFIGQLEQLEVLNLRETDIESLLEFRSLRNLRNLDLELTNLTNVSQLSRFHRLEELSLHGLQQLRDLSPLSNLKQLKQLEISYTAATDISPLIDLPALRWLEAKHVPGKNLGLLANIASLDILDIRGESLTNNDLRQFTGHPNLEFLTIDARFKVSAASKQLEDAQPDLSISYR